MPLRYPGSASPSTGALSVPVPARSPSRTRDVPGAATSVVTLGVRHVDNGPTWRAVTCRAA